MTEDFEDKVLEKLETLQIKQVEIYTVLLGHNGDTGLVGKVEKTCDHLEILEKEHNALSGKVKLLVGILAGSGALGGTIAGVIKLLS